MLMKVSASEVREGDFIPGLDNAYVFEAETNTGYMSYPRNGYGYDAAMPVDTRLISFHDADGEECYLMLPGDSQLTIERP
jgi:hypothetical protein